MVDGNVERRASRGPRIGYLLRMYPRFSQTFIVNEMLELERQGCSVRIGSLRKCNEGRFHDSVCRVDAAADYFPETLLERPGRTWRVHSDLLRRQPWVYPRAAGSVLLRRGMSWLDLVQAGHVLRWARKHRIAHAHVHFGTNEATVAMLAHMVGGLSYSLTLHAFDIFRDNVNRSLLARKINASRFTVTVSEYNRRFMIDHLPGVDAAKIRVNYNGIDLDRFHVPEAAREELTVFGVGRLIEKKGFLDLVRAVGRLRDTGLKVRCVIAGDGPERGALQGLIERAALRDQVELAGPLKQAEVQALLRRSRCFVLPCVRAKDGNVDALPTVLLEALASGCPAVSTRISGVPEIIEDGVSGLLVSPGDYAALAGAIRRVVTDGALAATLALNGRRRAEDRFDVRRNVRRMHDWFLDAAGAAGARAVSAKGHSGARSPSAGSRVAEAS
ncbi:MAG: glycosyltransferase [Phycisphaerae bacterium]